MRAAFPHLFVEQILDLNYPFDGLLTDRQNVISYQEIQIPRPAIRFDPENPAGRPPPGPLYLCSSFGLAGHNSCQAGGRELHPARVPASNRIPYFLPNKPAKGSYSTFPASIHNGITLKYKFGFEHAARLGNLSLCPCPHCAASQEASVPAISPLAQGTHERGGVFKLRRVVRNN